MKIPKIVYIFLAISLLIRLTYWLINAPEDAARLVGYDSKEYIEFSHGILKGEGYNLNGHPSLKRTPVYPFFLAVVQKIFGENNFLAATFIQMLLASLGTLLIFIIAKECFGLNAGILSSVFYTIDPLMLIRITQLSTEIITAFLVLVTLLALVYEQKHRTFILQIIAGICLALLPLTRPECFALAGLLPFFFLYANRKQGWLNVLVLKRLALILLVFIVTMSPWLIRNYFVTKKIFSISTLGGFSFLTETGGKWGFYYGFSPSEIPSGKLRNQDELYYDRYIYKKKMDYALKHPLQTSGIIVKSFLKLHHFSVFPLNDRPEPLYTFMLIFVFIGVYLFFRYRENIISSERYPVLMTWAGFSIMYSIWHSVSRYRTLFESCIIILSAYSISFMFTKLQKKTSMIITGSVILLSLVFFLFYPSFKRFFLAAGYKILGN